MATSESNAAAAQPNTSTNTPQTGGQNPDHTAAHATEGEATTTAPDDATSRGGYGGSSQGSYDNRDGAPRPEGGGQSNPAPTPAADFRGGEGGYTSAAAREGATSQGVGSKGGSYNDEYSNSPQPAEAGREATDADSTTGAASGLLNTGPAQELAEDQAQARAAAPRPDSGGASTGRDQAKK